MQTIINNGWEFVKLPSGSSLEDTAEARWKPVSLPHDWLIWQDDLYETADAWYRKSLPGSSISEPVCLIRFDGVYMDCDVLLNGEIICSHPYGYTSFYADLTGKIIPENNELMVHIRHQSPNSRWYSGSGIYRDVTMLQLPEYHIIPDSIYLRQSVAGDAWDVTVEAELSLPAKADFGTFCVKLLDADGIATAETQGECKGQKACAIMHIKQPHVWSIEDPYLYTLVCTLGKQTEVCKIGLRTVSFDPDQGFFLNGKNVKFKGVCLHHDLGALGSAFYSKAAKRQLTLMKNMGVNAIRTSHNPPASAFLDLCDEMGILVDDEAFDMWERSKTTYDYARFFPEWAEKDVASWVRRDRRHPCVVMWSIGNEIYDMHADQHGAEITEMLMNQVRKHDPDGHGAVTFGCNYMPWAGGQRCADIVKIPGYNYGEKLYDEHHRAHPDWVIYGSETASVLSSRGIYHFPIEQSIMSEADLQCSALGNSNTSWGANDLRKMIIDDMHTPFSMGQFIWSGIDYIGEPTPYHTRSCYFGQADTACFPKDAYYLFKAFWSQEPVVHIGVYWDWNPGQWIDVPVMTNAYEVELFLNGKSLGKRYPDREDYRHCLPVWKIQYVPGVLRAEARNEDGTLFGYDERHTPADTKQFILSTEDSVLSADQNDLLFVSIQAADENGYPVDNARDRVRILVSGGGYLMGTDNGDSADPDGYKQNVRRLFGGKLLAIIGSNGKNEACRIRVESNSCSPAEMIVPVSHTGTGHSFETFSFIDDQPLPDDIPPRKLEIIPLDSSELNADHPSCRFRWRIRPDNANIHFLQWQVTNAAGIIVPHAEVQNAENELLVTLHGDGQFYLRGLYGGNENHPDYISQIEINASGLGSPALNPYQFVSAGLYDLKEGDIGTGNEKGIAFARDGRSMVGYSNIDFGTAGSDTITLSIFALNGDAYQIKMYDNHPDEGGKIIAELTYQKPSIWNVYQPETYHLPVRLKGVHCICFVMTEKVHMKGFVFEKQSRAFQWQSASDADRIYGDSFTADGSSVRDIGNNVTLIWNDMDFGESTESLLCISGRTPLKKNTITVRTENEQGETQTELAEFMGDGPSEQCFRVRVPGGKCSVSLIFLPGCQFDFDGFTFKKLDKQMS